MIQNIVNGIIDAIREEYDKSYRIYTESIEQGLEEPCFSILCLNPLAEREIGQRYMRTFPVMITYFPSSTEVIQECNVVCENLLGLLGDISTKIGILHSIRMSGQTVDGNLQFNVEYKVPTMAVAVQSEPMEEIEINSSIE